mgnify:CR=1 FL=1
MTNQKAMWDKGITTKNEESATLAIEFMGAVGMDTMRDTNSMVALSGTDKQVAWAEGIRQKAILSLIDACATGRVRGSVADILNIISNESAKWWIDNRDNLSI